MKKLMTAALLAFVAIGSVSIAQDKKKPTTIKYYGNSFFEVISSKGTRIFIDPHNIEAFGQPKDLDTDILLMSHSHDDHVRINVVKDLKKKLDEKKLRIIPGWTGKPPRAKWNFVKETIKDVKIRSVGVFHDTVQGMKYGINTVFLIEVDGWKIAHLGDLGHRLTKKQIRNIGPVDVLMIPVGGIYTLNGSDAKKVVKQIKPKEYVFPMHYGTPAFNDLFSEEEFLEDWPVNQVARTNKKSVILNRDPNRPRPLIVMLHWYEKER